MPICNSRRSHNGVSPHDSDEGDAEDDAWLKQSITGVLGNQGVAADLESLSGWSRKSGNGSVGGRSYSSRRSYRSNRSHRSRKSKQRNQSYNGSSQSYNQGIGVIGGVYDNESAASSHGGISRGSRGSKSVAKDLIRLEQQLAKVAASTQQQHTHQNLADSNPNFHDGQISVLSGDSHSRASSMRSYRSKYSKGLSSTAVNQSRFTVTVPAGRLGVILANKRDGRGTVVSEVRLASVLYGKISPGDRILAVDGEDVSHFYLEEVTAIMSRKAGHERTLTILRAQPIVQSVVKHQAFPQQDYFAADFIADFG